MAAAEAGPTAMDATAKDLMANVTRATTMAVVTAQKIKPVTWRYAASAYCLLTRKSARYLSHLLGRRHYMERARTCRGESATRSPWSRWLHEELADGAQIELHEFLDLCNQARRGSKHAWRGLRGEVCGGPLLGAAGGV